MLSNTSGAIIDPAADDPHVHGIINVDSQIVLYVGCGWFFSIALVGAIVFLLTFSRFYRKQLIVSGLARLLTLSAVLGSVYMYTAGGQLLYPRVDSPNHVVLVRAGLVVLNGFVRVLLVYAGSTHCVLGPVYADWVLWLAVISSVQTTAASFVGAASQWPGWIVGTLFMVPVPFIWVLRQRRQPNHKPDGHVAAWLCLWLALSVAYALIQLTGHTFASGHGLHTTDELALMLVLHFITLCTLLYTTRFAMAPPPVQARDADMPNGDRLRQQPV